MRSAASGCRTNWFSTELKLSRPAKLLLVPAVIILISTSWAQTPSPSTPQTAPAASSGNQTNQQAPAPSTTAQPPRTESPSAEPPAGQNDASPQQPVSDGQEPAIQESGTSDQSGMFVFKKQVEEVVLHATVVDEQRHIVPGLDRSAFTVLENGVPQTITSFRREDVPVALGIVIDNSGSMRDKRDKINQAVLNLIRASNTQDEVFVVNFSDNPYLDQDFTSDEKLLQVALHRTSLKGTTALYDAVVASSAHLNKDAHLDKKVLLVITDGQDNMSRETLQDAARRLQQANGPTLYAIGLLGSGMQARGRDALKRLADGSGGVAYFPETLDEVDNLTRAIAHDIRTQYMIAYRPSNQNSRPQYQALHVEAHAPGLGKLTVRTKSGYYPPDAAH
jgi:Ca-activated chloride channel homolog